MIRKNIIILVSSVILFTLMAWLISCAVNPVTKKREFMLLTEADEIGLGQQTDKEIIETYGMFSDPALQAYVSSMGKQMGSLTHRPQLNYEFKILDTPVVNAFAVPGGFIYFTRGILAYLNNEAELAGVMAHELGHVNARHSAKQYSQLQLAQLGLGIGVAFSETIRKYAGIANFGVSMLFLKFSRDNEREADALGVEYSTKMKFDSNEIAKFFETLERMNPGSDQSGLPGWFSTHPNPPDRIKAVLRDTKTWQAKLPGSTFVVKRDEYLNKVNGIMFGEDPKQGYVENSIFYHPALKFQFPVPVQWQLNNTPSQVQMFTQQQDAVILFSVEKASSPAEAANLFVTNSKAAVQRSEQTRVNGLPAHRVVSDVQTEQGVLRISSYFIQYNNAIYMFHGYTDTAQFDKHFASFEQTMSQFKTLTDAARINVKPSKLVVKRTRTSATLRTALQYFGVPEDQLETTAIMNGMLLDKTVPPNTAIKLVEK